MDSMPCDSINPEERACNSTETRRACWSPLELLPRDLFSKIIDYVPESVFELRLTSRTIRYRVDEYAVQRPTSTLIAQLELFSNYYGSNSNHWLVGKVHVERCKSHLFELRLRLRQPSCYAHTPIKRLNVDDTRAVYKFEINVLSDARAMWAYLLESMGNRAEKVIVRQCETVRLLDVASQILEGIKFEKLKVVIENLLDGLEKHIAYIVSTCRVEQLYLFVTVVNLNEPAKFLLELSSYARAIHIYQYDIKRPSTRKLQELDFWRNAVWSLTPQTQHLWLDCYCPSNGQPLVWKDGTPTDYMGPNGELLSCKTGNGYHIHPEGFTPYDYTTPAPALCAYPANQVEETTTVEPTTPESIDVMADYCTCNPGSVYLDIVFVVDTSADMTKKTVGDATATIQSTLLGLTHGTDFFQSNVAVVAYGDKVQTVTNFGGFRSEIDIFTFDLPYLGGKATKMTDAILQASAMITSNEREFTRGVIVLLSKSFNQLDATNIREASDAFQYDGGIVITIDYSKGAGIKGLREISTTGYYINDASSRQDSLNADMLYAFCDANCFCPDGLYPYDVADQNTGREVPKGCYHIADVAAVYDAAEQNCKKQKGFVATVHDDAKNFFMVSIFPQKARYWLGLKRNGNSFKWDDGSNEPFTYWAPGNPIAGQDCVYGQQQSGFNSLGFSAPCTDPLKNSMTYACQLRPCDSEYDCWV